MQYKIMGSTHLTFVRRWCKYKWEKVEEKHINMHSPSLSIIGSKIKEKIDLKNV